MEMDSRKQKILEAVVLDYIETAEPVGSRTISKNTIWVSARPPFAMKWQI